LGRPRRGRSPGAYLAKKSPGEHPAPTDLPGELPGEHRVTDPASTDRPTRRAPSHLPGEHRPTYPASTESPTRRDPVLACSSLVEGIRG
jgi:hypothetical protein